MLLRHFGISWHERNHVYEAWEIDNALDQFYEEQQDAHSPPRGGAAPPSAPTSRDAWHVPDGLKGLL